ncbi:hypothetical protein ABT215_20280 [Streptomyces sp900105755]|uniref:hypothetical protein n=1 Tax=Streptomyces sp. 900105755 TaxID=3154389 RepID=UPI00332A7C23
MASTPFLLDCSKRHRTLRQVTRAGLTEWLSQCAAPHNDAVALRNMFKTLKSQRLLFAYPARGRSLGARPASVPTPLSPEAIQTLAAAAEGDPALKLLVALIGIHALYPHETRELPLAAVGFTGGRLGHGNIDHPLDAFTRQAAADYIQLRHSRRPHTRNPHLFLSSQTAHSRTPVTIGWMQPLLKDLPVAAQRLREDRILEGTAVTGADPQHTCARYSTSPLTPDFAAPGHSTLTPCPTKTRRTPRRRPVTASARGAARSPLYVVCGNDKKRTARGASGLVLAQEPAAAAGRSYR